MSIITRRNFIKSSALLGVGLTIDGVSASTQFTDRSSTNREETKPIDSHHWSVEETKVQTLRYFQKQGYSRVAPVSIISETDYNDGLTYDEAVYNFEETKAQFVLQSCSRVEDIHNKTKPGTLPFFTILAFSWAHDSDSTDSTKLLFDYLIGDVGLDPSRLRITTTELAEPLFPLFESYGVFLPQIRLRSLEEAMASGDGSGFFAPKDHPDSQTYSTYSVEYVLSPTPAKQKRGDVDTATNEIELAEIVLKINPGITAGGIGLERLMMAKNDKALNWESYLPVFKHAVLAAAQHEQKQLPKGYNSILGLKLKGI